MSAAAPTRTRRLPGRSLTLLPLIAATFFMVSGGPYGLEDLLQKAGYGRALLLLVLVPLIWSLPTTLMVGELSAALPEEGGYYAWVRRAMGPFWGFQEAWLSLLASIFDMAIYPTLFVLYLGRFVPALTVERNAFLAGAGVIGVCALWNIAGVRAVGKGSILLGAALLAPFAIMTVLALGHRGGAIPSMKTAAPADLLGGLLVAMWNFMGWDNASTVAGEVENPQRNYPRAMLVSCALVAVVYLVPVAAAAMAGIDPSGWSTGAWADAAGALGGRWLGLSVVAGGVLCGLGMTNALVLSYSRVPYAMANDGFLPPAFARVHGKTGVPWVSVVVCAAAWTLCLPLGFERLVQIDICLYGVSLLLEFTALIVLRLREPGLERPYRAPGGLAGAVALAVGPTLLLCLAFVRGRSEMAGPVSSVTMAVGLMAAGIAVYFLRRGRARAAATVAAEAKAEQG